MIGMRMSGNQKVDLGDPEFLQIPDNPVSLVNFTGIDQDDLVLKEDNRRVALPDIEEIYPQVARGIVTEGG